MCALVMSLCSRDLHLMSLNIITINSALIYTAPGFLDGKILTCFYCKDTI